jgi:GAF domain-containing protein
MRLADPDRLVAVQRAGLLGRSKADQFGALVYTAAKLVQADAAMVNILTEQRQIHMATWPMSPPPDRPVSEAGCRLVVEEGVTLCVEDALLHPVLCMLPWAGDPRGYLSAPVRFNDEVVGALCLLTTQPRRWSSHDVRAVEALAILAESLLAS